MKENCDRLVQEIKKDYSLIYQWHKNLGPRRIKEKYKENYSDSEYVGQYLRLLESLISPEEASIDYIEKIAHEILCNLMEWSYCEILDHQQDDLQMHVVARRIKEKIDKIRHISEDDRLHEEFKNFRNTSTDRKIRPVQIRFPIRHNQGWNQHEYQHLAALVYRDVPVYENNVGGQVVLIETNLELAKNNKEAYLFFNSKALNFDEIRDAASLVDFARNGAIVIERIELRG
jgi:hypothetical protein